MIDLLFWLPVMCAGVLSGGSSAALGVYIVGLRIPFLAVCVAHGALAGAVLGALLGMSGPLMLLPALAGAVAMALLLGALEGRGSTPDANIMIGVLFSLSLGLSFLGLGLFSILGRPDYHVRNLLWGSLTFCGWGDVALMGGLAALLALYLAALRKELRAILFSRLHAAAAGVPTTLVWTGFLVLTSAVLTVNFQTVGGLMIYSLVTNPAVAAYQLADGHDRVLVRAVLLGAAESLIGFLIAAWADLPTGATIVIVSSLVVGVAALVGRRRARALAPPA